MKIIYKRVAGLDVHKKTVVAARMQVTEEDRVEWETKTFGTTTPDLLELHDWLYEWELTHVAMESTGDYWKPVFNILEDSFEVWLVNAQHVKHVSGRKTDVKDSEWLAELMLHGLLKPSTPRRKSFGSFTPLSDAKSKWTASCVCGIIPGRSKAIRTGKESPCAARSQPRSSSRQDSRRY